LAQLTYTRRFAHELSEVESWQIYTACRLLFPDWHRDQENYRAVVDEFTDADHLMLKLQEIVIAHLFILPRRIQVNGTVQQAGGIAAVYTQPTHEGQGLMGQLLAAAKSRMTIAGYGLGLLFCDPEMRNFYAKKGWREFSGPLVYGAGGSRETLDRGETLAFWQALPGGPDLSDQDRLDAGPLLW